MAVCRRATPEATTTPEGVAEGVERVQARVADEGGISGLRCEGLAFGEGAGERHVR